MEHVETDIVGVNQQLDRTEYQDVFNDAVE